MAVGNEEMFARVGERLGKSIPGCGTAAAKAPGGQCWGGGCETHCGAGVLWGFSLGGRMRSQHVKIPGGWPESHRLRVHGRFKAGESHASTVFWDDNAGCGEAAALVRGVEPVAGVRWRWPQQPEGSSLGLRRALQGEGGAGESKQIRELWLRQG